MSPNDPNYVQNNHRAQSGPKWAQMEPKWTHINYNEPNKPK